MRVLVISQVWEPESGTPQRRWSWLTRHLVLAGHSVHAIVPPPHYPYGRLLDKSKEFQPGAITTGSSGETIHRCSFREHDFSLSSRIRDQVTMAWSQMRIARRIIHSERPDVIIATAPPLPAVYTAFFLSASSKIPLIVDLRDAWPDLLADMGAWDPRTQLGRYRKLKKILMRVAMSGGGWALEKSLRHASGIITTTDSFSSLQTQRGSQHTLTLRNLGAQRYISSPPPDLSAEPLRVLYAGTTGRAQGLLNALEALTIARDQGTDIRMRIIGMGVDYELLKRYAREHSLPVEFLGRIPFDKIPDHYTWAHTVLVHLRDWKAFNHTVPSKLYEALE
ncbi:MAG: hypothetical protein CSA82_03525, partial [Actinobacteria bacterium]